jgi:hypothetical protein
MLAIRGIITLHPTPVQAVIQRIITRQLTQIILQHSFLKLVQIVTLRVHGLLQPGITTLNISRFILENIRVNGIHVPIAIKQPPIIRNLAASIAMSTINPICKVNIVALLTIHGPALPAIIVTPKVYQEVVDEK